MKLPHLETMTTAQLRSPVWIYDIISKRIAWANPCAVSLWEAADLTELQQRDFSDDQSDAVEQTLLGYLERFKTGEVIDLWWEISPAGIRKRVFSRLSGAYIPSADGPRLAMLVEAQHSPELINAVGIPSAALTVLFNDCGEIRSFNPPFAEQFGEKISNLSEILPEHDAAPFIQEIGSLGRDIELKTLKGLRWHHAEIALRPELSNHAQYALTLIDIHERKLQEMEIAKEARSDFLTGLMNRRGLLQYMAGFDGSDYTLFYIDLDGFKPVNDTYGHNMGDTLLCQLANVLMAQQGRKVCARVGGDEFVVIFFEALQQDHIHVCAQQLLRDLSAPRQLAPGCEARVSGSIGIAVAPDDADDVSTLMIHADAAMYEAKKRGRNQAVIYQPGMESWLRRRAQILHHLDNAIATNQLDLHFQPIVEGVSGDTVLVEALVRWQHPTLGPLSPLEFIAVAEDSGKIAALERWVIRHACQALPTLRRIYRYPVRVNINISGAHIAKPDFIENLQCLLSQQQCSAKDIVLELTESVLVPVLEKQDPCLEKLVAAGFQLAIDDFGTGYSSLAYINQLPAHYVKIDKAFVTRLDKDPHTLLFIRDLCEKFGMRCIAEGVEQPAQNIALNNAGILLQQGYYFARPAALPSLTVNGKTALLLTQ